MNIKTYLTEIAIKNSLAAESMQFPNCEIDPKNIKVVMVNEVVPKNPDDWFYSEAHNAENKITALGLFQNADIHVKNMSEIIKMGIYITAALKTPKEGYTAAPASINAQLPLLEAELALFPDVKVIMLMGDVAIKMVNMIAKTKLNTKKNICPTGAAGRRRHWNNEEFYWEGIRIIPSYIMTGKNLLIEPFKRDTITEDIRRVIKIIKNIK